MNVTQYKSRVAALGCLVCGDEAELHHPREGRGMSQRASDWLVVPLCPMHHRGGTTFMYPSIHGAPQFFKVKYGDEFDLVAQVIERLHDGS